jgi:hypothetical protein
MPLAPYKQGKSIYFSSKKKIRRILTTMNLWFTDTEITEYRNEKFSAKYAKDFEPSACFAYSLAYFAAISSLSVYSVFSAVFS